MIIGSPFIIFNQFFPREDVSGERGRERERERERESKRVRERERTVSD